MLDRVSIELTNLCAKSCAFCYNESNSLGSLAWDEEELLEFIDDLIAGGIKAISFGGGEPLQYPGLFRILSKTRKRVSRSLTTNGLLLPEKLDELVAARPNKVQISIHFPEDSAEVDRVIEQYYLLSKRGITSGINFLVAKSKLSQAAFAAKRIRDTGITNRNIVYLPMRKMDTPSAKEILVVAGEPFQSTTCLETCGKSERFCSISANKTVAWCSYTDARMKLEAPTYKALLNCLQDLGVNFCGGKEENGAV